MNEHGKSDGSVVPSKSPNKGVLPRQRSDGEPYTGTKVETPDTAKGEPKAQRTEATTTAEAAEGRDPANGNPSPPNTFRTPSREDVHSARERVRQAARNQRLVVTTGGRSPVR